MNDLKKAHTDTDVLIEKTESELEFDYDNANEQLNRLFSEFFRKYEKLYEKKLNELKSGLITKKQYCDYMVQNVLLSKDWKYIKNKLADFYVTLNQRELNLINEKMVKIYELNYNAVQKSIQKEVI